MRRSKLVRQMRLDELTNSKFSRIRRCYRSLPLLIEKQIILDRAAAIDFRKSALHISVTLHRYFANVDRIIRSARDKFEDIIPHETKINEV